jgi:hypothetical protein
MALKVRYGKKEDIPAGKEDLYEEASDGSWVLTVEGIDDHPGVKTLKTAFEKEKTDRKERAEKLRLLQDAIGDLDLEEARKAIADSAALREKKLVSEGKVDQLLAERTAQMKADYEKRIAALDAKDKAATGQLEHLLITSQIQAHAAKLGVRPTALEDVTLRGRQLFRVKDGQAVAMRDEAVVYGKDGTTPMGIEEWIRNIQPEAPHLFEPSGGGGAKGDQGSRQGAGAKVIKSSDKAGFGASLEDIASGKVEVSFE